MDNTTEWIEHLKHPLVLAGFGLFILAMLLKPLFANSHKKLSGRATERLMSKAIKFVFILALLVIVAGFVLSLKSGVTTNMASQQEGNTTETTTKVDIDTAQKQKTPVQVKQITKGDKSPAINSSGDVEVNYAE